MAYKFQSGDATLSGSVTLVNYQDLLFESDGVSDIGTAAKEARVVYTTRQTASVGISGSAVYANNFYGNGSGLTGVPGSTTSKVTGSNQNVDLQLVLVQNAGTTETLLLIMRAQLRSILAPIFCRLPAKSVLVPTSLLRQSWAERAFCLVRTVSLVLLVIPTCSSLQLIS